MTCACIFVALLFFSVTISPIVSFVKVKPWIGCQSASFSCFAVGYIGKGNDRKNAQCKQRSIKVHPISALTKCTTTSSSLKVVSAELASNRPVGRRRAEEAFNKKIVFFSLVKNISIHAVRGDRTATMLGCQLRFSCQEVDRMAHISCC